MATPPSRADFVLAFPEFEDALPTLVDAKLIFAADEVNSALYGIKATRAVMLRAADLLAKSPQGRAMKLVNKDGTTAYTEDIKTLQRAVTVGLRCL